MKKWYEKQLAEIHKAMLNAFKSAGGRYNEHVESCESAATALNKLIIEHGDTIPHSVWVFVLAGYSVSLKLANGIEPCPKQ